MKTVGMTVGEIELAETFLTATDSSSAEHFDEYSESHKILKYIVVLLFILILPTITQNLLVSRSDDRELAQSYHSVFVHSGSKLT